MEEVSKLKIEKYWDKKRKKVQDLKQKMIQRSMDITMLYQKQIDKIK